MAITLVTIFLSSCEKEEVLTNLEDEKITNYEFIDINPNEIFTDVTAKNGNFIKFKLPYKDLSFELESIDIFEGNKEESIYIIEKDGSKTPAKLPEIHFFGNKKGVKEAVFMSLEEGVMRLEYTKDEKTYNIVPASDVLDNQTTNKYVIYSNDDMIKPEQDINCFHVDATADDITEYDEPSVRSKRATYTLKLGGIIDYKMYQHYGQSGAISQVLNQVAAAHQIYANNNMNVDIVWSKGYIDKYNNLKPTTETYDSQTFFNQWAAWATGPGAWAREPNVDNFYIWTGYWLKNTGAMGGTGFCCRSNYSTCGFINIRKANNGGTTWKNRVLAHEIGHSLGASHSTGLMKWNTASGTFSWTSKNQINNHLNSYSSCLYD